MPQTSKSSTHTCNFFSNQRRQFTVNRESKNVREQKCRAKKKRAENAGHKILDKIVETENAGLENAGLNLLFKLRSK